MINAKLKDNQRLADKASINPDLLRQRRAIAFRAFDIFKTNVLVMPEIFDPYIQNGMFDDVQEIIDEAKDWYMACLDMDHPEKVREALRVIPPYIAKYMDA